MKKHIYTQDMLLVILAKQICHTKKVFKGKYHCTQGWTLVDSWGVCTILEIFKQMMMSFSKIIMRGLSKNQVFVKDR